MNAEDYALAELTLAQAKLCVSLKPDDPKVGAVLKRHGEEPVVAHRGQLAQGDHAEFTLLQKIVRSKDVTQGATLYTTLEPCTTRSHDKLPCADWVVRKGIRRVVVGMLDPNPAICGRGYWRLIEAGIDVELFPPELAKQVAEINTPFIALHRSRTIASKVATLIQSRKSAVIAPYLGLGWGDALSLQDAPYIREGWPIDSVQLRLLPGDTFKLPDRLRPAYAGYCAAHEAGGRFRDDPVKLMLVKNPTAFSDSPTLVLQVARTKWSEVQFYREHIATAYAEKAPLIEQLIRGSLRADYPNSLCMHLVAVTRDRQILLTRRSPKVEYYPNSWSASIEEQLDEKDLGGAHEASCEAWGRRCLAEELGLTTSGYSLDTFKLLSVFLESDTLNLSIAACVELTLDADVLSPMLRALPRRDWEFTEWAFLPCQRGPVMQELLTPSRNYHPTSGFRLLTMFLKEFGVPKDEELAPKA